MKTTSPAQTSDAPTARCSRQEHAVSVALNWSRSCLVQRFSSMDLTVVLVLSARSGIIGPGITSFGVVAVPSQAAVAG
jgi:hypothetical protein